MTEFDGQPIRKCILEQSMRAGVGHIGSALSIADIVAALFSQILQVPSSKDPNRDRFILSKGHAALAVYAALHLKGSISADLLNSFCGDDTLLGVHPEHFVEGIDFSSGSLGQGLSIGAGCALAAQMEKSPRRSFVLLSDGECNEGAIWEAIMFAAHHRLSQLVAAVDLNGQQAFGYTKDVLSLSPLAEKWRAFGWDVHEVDGHDCQQITETIQKLDMTSGQPHVLIAKTVFGKGVSFMESQIKWHYWPMCKEEYAKALAEVEKGT